MLKILSLREQFGHMSNVSGYDALYAHVPEGYTIDSVFGTFNKIYPRGIGRLLQFAAREANASSMYNAQSVEAEAKIGLRAWQNNPQLIHYAYGEPYVGYTSIVDKLFNGPIVATNHQPQSWWKDQVRLYNKYRRLDKVICLTEYDCDVFNKMLPGKAVYIPHGVDVNFFRPSATKKQPFTVVFSGRYLRDTVTLTSVIKKIIKSSAQISFSIIYSDKDRLSENTLAEIKRLPCVHWYTDVSANHLKEIYQQAHCCLIPLLDCTANNAILEAMACGLPIISTDLPGIKTYLDSSCAILGSPGKAGVLADAIIGLYDQESKCTAMGNNARIRAVERYDWNLVALQTFKLFNSLVA